MELTNRKSSQDFKKINLITFTNQMSKISEQYRMIRTNFLSSENCKSIKTLIVTSPNRREGKSTTAANFAISLAQQGKKVLLIDADFRNSILSCSFKMDNSIGLSNLLNGRNRIEDGITNTEIKGLDLLTSGKAPLNPTELLGSQSMELLIETVVELYDIVIIDTPPVLDFSDAKIIANQCDGILLVIRWGKTKGDEAIETKKLLEPVKAELLGIIINDQE